jgi:NAD(P)-dependent dehydrogenase (short-subunit alcohol dehydrogenase family)
MFFYEALKIIAGIVCVAITIVIMCRKWIVAGKQCQQYTRLDGKIAIVTGASTGIGKESARILSLQGAIVVGTTRNANMCNALEKELGSKTVFMRLDLSSFCSIVSFINEFKKRYGRCDILVNNAGVMAGKLCSTVDGFEGKFGANHLGHFLLTIGLLSIMPPRSRVVTVSSLGHAYAPLCTIDFSTLIFDDWKKKLDTYDSLQMYCQSKMANILFAKELARRNPDIVSVSVNPGRVYTDTVERECFSTGFGTCFRWIAKFLLKTPLEGAQTTLHCVFTKNIVQGAYYSNCTMTPPRKDAEDAAIASKLWAYSELKTNHVLTSLL